MKRRQGRTVSDTQDKARRPTRPPAQRAGTHDHIIPLPNVSPPLQTANEHPHVALLELHRLLARRLALGGRVFRLLGCGGRRRDLDVHALVRNRRVGPFPVLCVPFLRGYLLGSALLLLLLKLLALLERNDVLPVHVVLHVAHVRELREETLAAERRAVRVRRHRLVVLRAVQDVVQVHLVELLVLLAVILVKAARLQGFAGGGEKRERKKSKVQPGHASSIHATTARPFARLRMSVQEGGNHSHFLRTVLQHRVQFIFAQIRRLRVLLRGAGLRAQVRLRRVHLVDDYPNSQR